MALTKITTTSCWICAKEVSLKDCKIDERGHAVHEDCYVARVKLQGESNTPATSSRTTE
jgi:hypothetical protein